MDECSNRGDVMAGPITRGIDYNYFNKLTISAASFATNSDAAPISRGQITFSLVNEGTGVIEYSFNGNTLHGDLTPGTPTAALFFDDRRVGQIWFRLKSGAASIVRIEAWSA